MLIDAVHQRAVQIEDECLPVLHLALPSGDDSARSATPAVHSVRAEEGCSQEERDSAETSTSEAARSQCRSHSAPITSSAPTGAVRMIRGIGLRRLLSSSEMII